MSDANVSVVIPIIRDTWNETHRLLFSILELRNPSLQEVIVVNTTSDAIIHNGLNFWKSVRNLPLRVFDVDEMSLVQASNFGIRKVRGDIAIRLMSDVYLNPNQRRGNVFSVVSIELRTGRKIIGGDVVNYADAVNTIGKENELDVFVPYVTDWLIAGKTDEILSEGFNESYSDGFHHIEFSYRAVSEGYELIKLPYGYGTPYPSYTDQSQLEYDRQLLISTIMETK